ncbi:Ig-like domain-containing protein [Bifidobacterium sp. ESL0704]|uniref:endo-beta-N-acetylglucosaminidase n=1 Tax=Bifidobacterium sp. ESL0704 TaxID=2983219 RepID=UPI0023F638DF|nr:Ig-like domain-containing protein [Bifidobacterium sp. ESL0704]WEV53460.1 Ig-like domain-containing protein [Bifidobacterium sp. ESL0704]
MKEENGIHSRHRRGVRAMATTLFGMTLSAAMMFGGATAASATDTLPWGMTDAKYAVGENQPYNHGYTGEDILNWSPGSDEYASRLRARVPLQQRIAPDAATQKDANLPSDTQMFDLAGDYGNAFFESFHDNNVFSQYLFDYWQYADYYGSWHGQPSQGVDKTLYDPNKDWTQKWFEFGMMNLPNPAYTNAAHKNGAKSIGAIFLSDNDRGEQTYRDLLKDKAKDGSYPVAAKLVEIAKYFGFDGYFINQESAVDAQDIGAYKDFIKQITDQGIYVQWYDAAVDGTGNVDYQNQFNAANSPWVKDPAKGKISDSIFLNYWYDNNMLKNSAAHARSLGLDPKQTVFAGLEAGGHKFDSIDYNAKHMQSNLDANGKPLLSLAALGSDFVSSELGDSKKVKPEYQNEVFDRERRLWTGSSDGTGDDQADGWKGFSSQIAERSVIGGPVFSTTFNTGHGLEWRDAGKTSSSQEWGNINLQDVPVTWQWWIDAANNPLQADFDYGQGYTPASRFHYQKLGAYEGGDSLVLSGKLSSDNTVRLFKTDLDVSAGTKVKLTYNKPSGDDSTLNLGVVFADAPQSVVPVRVADGAATNGWKTASVDLSQYAGRKVATLGLVIDKGANPIDSYQVNIGKLTFADQTSRTPAAPQGLSLQRLFSNSSEADIAWKIGDYNTVKNYLVYLNGKFLGGRYDDNLYIKKLPAASGELELVAVGADGSRSPAATLKFDESRAVGAIKVKAGKDGKLSASWTNPQQDGDKTVTLASASGSWRYGNHPYQVTRQAAKGATGVDFGDVPVDGSRYVLTVKSADGSFSSAEGAFADATIEPYPICSATWNAAGTAVTLSRPQTQDWRYIHVTERWKENGVEKSEPIVAQYTYSQQTPPTTGIIRGRTKPQSYTIAPTHGGDLYVSYEDYRGNATKPVKVAAKDEMASCSVPDMTKPDASTSSMAASSTSSAADGKSPQTVKAVVKDSFGNPQIGANVRFELPEQLQAAAKSSAVNAVTDNSGTASISVVSSSAGTYVVKALLDGAAIGDGVSLVFKAAPSNGSQPTPAPGDGQKPSPAPGNGQVPSKPGAVQKPASPGKGGSAAQKPTATRNGLLSSTGADVTAVCLVAVAMVFCGCVICAVRRRS